MIECIHKIKHTPMKKFITSLGIFSLLFLYSSEAMENLKTPDVTAYERDAHLKKISHYKEEKWQKTLHVLETQNTLVTQWQNHYPLGHTLPNINKLTLQMSIFEQGKKYAPKHNLSTSFCTKISPFPTGEMTDMEDFLEYIAHRCAGYEKPNVLLQIWRENKKGYITLVHNYSHHEPLESFKEKYLLSVQDLRNNKRTKKFLKQHGNRTHIIFMNPNMHSFLYCNVPELNEFLWNKTLFHIEHHPTSFETLLPKYLDFIQAYCNVPPYLKYRFYFYTPTYERCLCQKNFPSTFGTSRYDKYPLTIVFNTIRYQNNLSHQTCDLHQLSYPIIRDHIEVLRKNENRIAHLSTAPIKIVLFIQKKLSNLNNIQDLIFKQEIPLCSLVDTSTMTQTTIVNKEMLDLKMKQVALDYMHRLRQDFFMFHTNLFPKNFLHISNLEYFIDFKSTPFFMRHLKKYTPRQYNITQLSFTPTKYGAKNYKKHTYDKKKISFPQFKPHDLTSIRWKILPLSLTYNKSRIKGLINPLIHQGYYKKALHHLSMISPRGDLPPKTDQAHTLFLRILRVVFDYAAHSMLYELEKNNVNQDHLFFLLLKKYYDLYHNLTTTRSKLSGVWEYWPKYENIPLPSINPDLPLIFSAPKQSNDPCDDFIAIQVPCKDKTKTIHDSEYDFDRYSDSSSDDPIYYHNLYHSKNQKKNTSFITKHIHARSLFVMPCNKNVFKKTYKWLLTYERSESVHSLHAIPQYLIHMKSLAVDVLFRKEIRATLFSEYLHTMTQPNTV